MPEDFPTIPEPLVVALRRQFYRQLHRFIPERALQSRQDVLRSRILVASILLLGVILGVLALLAETLIPMGPGVIDLERTLVFSFAAGMVLALVALRATGSTAVSANLLLTAIQANLILTAAFFGGFQAPTLPAMLIVPVLAALLAGRASSLVWGVAVISSWLGFFALEGSQRGFESLLGAEGHSISVLLNLTAACITTLSVVLLYERTNSRLRTELAAERAAFETLAAEDPLTGLPNRRSFADRLETALRRADRSGRFLALCIVDLDGFKRVNDQYGHAAGDEILRTVASRLCEQLRTTDSVARLGATSSRSSWRRSRRPATCRV